MKFKDIKLKNFKSFAGDHSFSFDVYGPGLHFLAGDNQVEPRLGSNGAGKSTLYDALFWCLFGKTTRNLRATNVHTWGAKGGTKVSLSIVIGGEEYLVARSWSPNTLTINGENVEQDRVDSLIGLSPDAFQASILLGQFSSMFFDLPPAQKMTMFTELLILDFWMTKSDEAKNKHAVVREKLEKKEKELADKNGRIALLTEDLERFRSQARDFGQQRAMEIKDAMSKVKGVRKERRGVQTALDGLRGELEDEESKLALEEEEELQEKLGGLLAKAHKAHDEYQMQVALHNNSVKELNAFIKDVQSGQCPTCKQGIDEVHVEKHVQKLGKKINDAKLAVERAKRAEEKAKKEHDRLRDGDINNIEQYNSTVENNIESIKQDIAELESYLITLNVEAESAESELKTAQTKANPYDRLVLDREQQIDIAQTDVIELQAAIKKLSEEADAYAFWIRGFKEVRLLVVEEALATLELEVNSSLVQLGLEDWTVTFDIERETKSGTISRGFTIMVQSPYNPEPVPWEAWCGGETQRLRLAGTMGLASMLLRSRGIDTNLIVLDEPTQHMSQLGVENLLDLLAAKAHAESKQVWVIDHHSLEYGGFDSTTIVRKTNDGSEIIN